MAVTSSNKVMQLRFRPLARQIGSYTEGILWTIKNQLRLFPSPTEVDRFLYAPIRLRGREREAVQFPSPREVNSVVYLYICFWSIKLYLISVPSRGGQVLIPKFVQVQKRVSMCFRPLPRQIGSYTVKPVEPKTEEPVCFRPLSRQIGSYTQDPDRER